MANNALLISRHPRSFGQAVPPDRGQRLPVATASSMTSHNILRRGICDRDWWSCFIFRKQIAKVHLTVSISSIEQEKLPFRFSIWLEPTHVYSVFSATQADTKGAHDVAARRSKRWRKRREERRCLARPRKVALGATGTLQLAAICQFEDRGINEENAVGNDCVS